MTKRNTITTNSSVYHKNLIDFKKIYIYNTFALGWAELVSYCVKLMLRISGFTFFFVLIDIIKPKAVIHFVLYILSASLSV